MPVIHSDRVAVSLYWVGLVLAVAAGTDPLVPPGSAANPEPTEFSVDRAQEHIVVVAQQPHPIGSAAIEDVRHYIASQLRGLGLESELQVLSAPDYYDGSSATVPIVNVIARIEGTAPTGSVALVAHFDTDPSTPGANDNASGVAVVLETARSLLAAGPPRNDVILVFTDGEEPAPRFGSTAFVADHRWSDEIRFVINLEAVGSDGPSLLIELNGPHHWVLDRYFASAPHPVAFSFLTELTELIGGSNTDFAPFRDAGIPGVEFAYAHGSSIYHTAADTPDRVSRRSVQAHGANTLGLTRDLAQIDLSTTGADSESAFFTFGRNHVVRYPTSWGLPVAVLAGVVLFGPLNRRKTWPGVARGALMALIIAVSIAIVVAVLWVVLAGWRNDMGVVESYVHLFGLSALVAAVMVMPFSSRPGIGMRIQPEAIILVWWVLGLLTAVTIPGVSYLFSWPAFAGAFALSVRRCTDDGWRQVGPATVTLGAAAIVMVPAIDTFFQFSQPRPGNPDSEILPTVAIPTFLVALVVQLALAFRVTSTAFRSETRRSSLPPRRQPSLPPGRQPCLPPGRQPSLLPGRQPWDPANGLRIGTMTGALVGAVVVALTGLSSFWIVAVCGAVGGGIGFWSEKRKQKPRADETHRVLLPTTSPGRWSMLAAAASGALVVIFALTVAAGQRGGEEFFDNLWLALPGLGAYLAAVAAFMLGIGAIAASGERSVTVMVVTVLGFLVTAFGVLEVLFPH